MVMQLEKRHETNEDLLIGFNIKIKKLQDLNRPLEPEDFYYLKNFESKTGTIVKQNKSSSGTHSYRVDFDENTFGYFYREDFELLENI